MKILNLLLLIFISFSYSCFSQQSIVLDEIKSNPNIKFKQVNEVHDIPQKVLTKFKEFGYGLPLKMANPNEPFQNEDYVDSQFPWTRLIYGGISNYNIGFVFFEAKESQPYGIILYKKSFLKKMDYEVYSIPLKLDFEQLLNYLKSELKNNDKINRISDSNHN